MLEIIKNLTVFAKHAGGINYWQRTNEIPNPPFSTNFKHTGTSGAPQGFITGPQLFTTTHPNL